MGRNRGRRVALVWCLCLLAAITAWGQEEQPAPKIDPKADGVMREVCDFYGGLQNLAVAVTTTMRFRAGGINLQTVLTQALAMRRPNRLVVRTQMNSVPCASVVCDGQKVYTFLPVLNKYTVRTAPEELDDLLGEQDIARTGAMWAGDAGILLTVLLASKPYEKLMQGVTAGQHLGIIQLNGAEYHHMKFYQKELDWEIWVKAPDEPLLYRFVPDLSRELGVGEMGQTKVEVTVVFDKWAVNPQLPDSLFVFTPPAGAQKVESFFGGMHEQASPLLGKPAPPFKLNLLDGGEVDLAAHKDKDIVILDFWATWCGPCRRAMPIIAEVAEASKDKGVVLYAVNQGEPADTVREFLEKQGLKVTVALDEKKEVGALYGVRGIPQTVIIGRDSTVQAVHVGFSPGLKEKLSADLDALLAGKPLAAPEAEEKEAP